MGTLHIPKTPQYGVLIEKVDTIKDSLFYDIYNDAASNIVDIIAGQASIDNEPFYNPCIAFVGKRGTGKSSAMCSFANLLKSSKKNCEWIQDENAKKTISKSKFHILPAIDTANMSKKETIVADVSAEMYNEFKEKLNDLEVENKRKFISSAMKVNDTAILKSSGEWANQGDKLLVETDKIVHLKSLFEEMVKDFLSIIKDNTSIEDSYLVIQIDDLDMNICNSFSIMEEIRNILSIKNVIVLLSVDIEQLKTVLKLNFTQSLDSKHSESANKISKDLSYKYIEKLLPLDRRHYMPELTIDQLRLHNSKNFLADEDKNWDKMNLSNTNNSSPSILYSVLHLIWRKTMLIPMCNEHGDYLLLPHNLRSLCNFIVFLRNMKDAAYDEQTLDEDNPKPLTYFDFADEKKGHIYRNNAERNLRDLYNYLVSNLEMYNIPEMNNEDKDLSDTLIALIQTFSDVKLSEINSKIVRDIIYSIKSGNTHNQENHYYKTINAYNNSLDKILKATIYPDTISLGDVMFLLGKLDRITNCSYIRYLIEVIRTLWSIRMTLEVYVNGCNKKNENHLISESYFITEDFRSAVGSLIINPDATESFYGDVKNQKNDWHISKGSQSQSLFDIVIPKDSQYIENIDNENINIHEWRIHLNTGNPSYKQFDEKNDFYHLSHPLTLFSNLLYPKLIPNTETYIQWQNNFIMAFPFFSMDYMCRLYKEFHNNCKRVKCSTNSSIMENVFANIKNAAKKLCEETKNYISLTTFQSTYNVSILEIFKDRVLSIELTGKEDFLLEAPIKYLELINDWQKELLLINYNLVELLDKFIKDLEPLLQDPTFNTNNLTNQWLSLTKYFNEFFPKDFIQKNYDISIQPIDGNFNAQLQCLKELLKDITEGNKIKAFYYYQTLNELSESLEIK